MSRFCVPFIPLLAATLFCGCGSSDASNGPSTSASGSATASNDATLTPTYSSIRANIFQSRCLGCHSSSSASGGVVLETHETLMHSASSHGHEIVVPGNAETSHLYVVVRNGEMPRGGPRLSDAEQQAIRDWISQGAQNN